MSFNKTNIILRLWTKSKPNKNCILTSSLIYNLILNDVIWFLAFRFGWMIDWMITQLNETFDIHFSRIWYESSFDNAYDFHLKVNNRIFSLRLSLQNLVAKAWYNNLSRMKYILRLKKLMGMSTLTKLLYRKLFCKFYAIHRPCYDM